MEGFWPLEHELERPSEPACSDGKRTELPLATAVQINARGDIAGGIGDDWRTVHAALYSGGKVVDLGTPGGVMSYVVEMTDATEILGNGRNGQGAMRPFLWREGKMNDLGAPLGGRPAAGPGSARVRRASATSTSFTSTS